MKKFLLGAVAVLAIISLFAVGVSAETDEPEDITRRQYDAVGADDIENSLTDEAREFLENAGIDGGDFFIDNELDTGNFFDAVLSLLSVNIKGVIVSTSAALGIVVLSSLISGISNENALDGVLSLCVTASAALCLIVPISKTAVKAFAAVGSGGRVIMCFVPVMAGVLIGMGKNFTSAGFSGIMLTAAEVITFLTTYVFAPLISAHMALSLCFVPNGALNTEKTADAVKKFTNWTLLLFLGIFVFLLGIQTSVSSGADNLGLQTAKFVLGSSVPVVGTAVGEALGTVRGCLSLLGASVGGYTAIAVAAVFLPTVLELAVWRLALTAVSAVSGFMANERMAKLADGLGDSLGLMIGILLCILVMFIISLTMVMRIGGRI